MKKINSLQALRGICYIGVFLFHIGYENLYGELAVSIFFVLSGFLTVYTNKNNNERISFKDCLFSAYLRIKKLFWLHVITTLAIFRIEFLALSENQSKFTSFGSLFRTLLLNITLTKALVPSNIMSTSLNGVSWFLATIFIIYIFSPYLVKFVKNNSKKKLIIICICMLLLQITTCIPVFDIFGIYSDISVWYVYRFPLFRLVDYFCGIVIGKCYQDIMEIKVNEIVKYVLFVVLVIASYYVAFTDGIFDNVVLSAILNSTSKRIPLAVLWLIFFLRSDTVFVRVLNNPIFRYLGDLNMYLYLIHNVVLIYLSCFVFTGILANPHVFNIFAFFASIILAEIYRYFANKNLIKNLIK